MLDAPPPLPTRWTRAVLAHAVALATASSRPHPLRIGDAVLVRGLDVAGRITAIRGTGRHAIFTVGGANGCSYDRKRAGLSS